MWQKNKIHTYIFHSKHKVPFFFFILMAIHDEGRFTMIQTKNTNSLKKKMRTKMAKTRITRFLQINIALHCKSEIQPFN